jgi:protein CpxP
MKKILMVCAFVLGISAVSFAQGGGRQQRTPEVQAKEMQTSLKLNDDQTSKVTAVFQSQAKMRDSIRTASNGDRQAMMSAMRPMMEATSTKLKAILTPEQYTEYEKANAERMNRMRQGGQNGGGNPPPSQK